MHIEIFIRNIGYDLVKADSGKDHACKYHFVAAEKQTNT